MGTAELVREIERRRELRLRSLDSPWRRSVPVASDIDPRGCERRQHLELTGPPRDSFPLDLLARFEVGNLWEREIVAELLQMGFTVEAGQTPFELRARGSAGSAYRPVLRGKIDGKLRWDGALFPFEIKSMAPAVFQRVVTLDDLQRFAHTARYVYQLQAYLIGHGHDAGLLILTDCLGHWRLLQVGLDYAVAESIWSFAEGIVGRLDAGTDVAMIAPSSDPDECARCRFFRRGCEPPIREAAAAALATDEYAAKLDRWAETAQAAREHASLDDELKGTARDAIGSGSQAVGRYVLTVSKSPRKGYTVAAADVVRVKIQERGEHAEG